MTDPTVDPHDFECVETEVGETIWRLAEPDLPARTRRQLENHLMICDACRLRWAMQKSFASGLADGSLQLGGAAEHGGAPPLPVRNRSALARGLSWVGGLAIAASLAMMILTPPVARDGDRIIRSADAPRFLRPVEGEVVASRHPRLSWAPIDGATSYRVTVTEVGGSYAWAGETDASAIAIPADAPLPSPRDLRAYLEPVPADLAPPGGVTVSFRTGPIASLLIHRLVSTPSPVKILGLLGALAACGAIGLRLFPPART